MRSHTTGEIVMAFANAASGGGLTNCGTNPTTSGSGVLLQIRSLKGESGKSPSGKIRISPGNSTWLAAFNPQITDTHRPVAD